MRPAKWEEIISHVKTPHLSAEASTFNYLANISFKYNYMYVETPKVACSSIKRTLINAELGYVLQYDDFEDLHVRHWSPLVDPARTGSFETFLDHCKFKFCFVRSPYTRLLSCYLDKIEPKNAWRRSVVTDYFGAGQYDEIKFADFVEFVCNQGSSDMDPHWRIQTDLCCINEICYDFIGRFENFSRDFRYVLDRIGVEPSLFYIAETSHSTNADRRSGQFFTKEIKKKVYEKFIDDFETFNYER